MVCKKHKDRLACPVFVSGALFASDEMANVVECFHRFDIEARIGRHVEFLTAFVCLPVGCASQLDAAFACIQFHDFGSAGVEFQSRWKNHADGFLGAVGEQDGVRHALAVEIQVGFF